MDDQNIREIEEGVTDLGAASEVTFGVWDPMLKENFVMPQARDY